MFILLVLGLYFSLFLAILSCGAITIVVRKGGDGAMEGLIAWSIILSAGLLLCVFCAMGRFA